MKYQRKVSFAIVGCGLIGNKRAGTLPQGSLKWASDLDSAKASALVSRHGGQVATEASEVFMDPEIDIVLISAAVAPNSRESSGSSACGEYRLRNAQNPLIAMARRRRSKVIRSNALETVAYYARAVG